MAIYFPRLFCDIGQRLLVKADIVFDDGIIISEGEYCFVEDIKGYGFDIVSEKKAIEIRIMNSEMDDYFVKVSSEPSVAPLHTSLSSAFQNLVRDLTGKESEEDEPIEFRDILMFTKEFTIKDVLTIRHGERFFYEEDNGYYDLYDVVDYWRLLRMKEKEVQEFCQLQTAEVEEGELV